MRRVLVLLCAFGLLVGSALPVTAQEDQDREVEGDPVPIEDEEAAEEEGAESVESVEGTASNSFERAVQLIEPSVVYLGITVTAWVNDGEDWLNDGYAYEHTTHCSGTIIDATGYILTAGHCVDPEDFRDVFIRAGVEEWVANEWNLNEDGTVAVSAEELYAIGYDNWSVEGEQPGSSPDVDVTVELATSVAGLAGGRAMGARVVDFSSLQDGDVALLKVEQTDLPATPVAASDPNVGAEIVSVGFPATVDLVTDPDLNAAYKDGRISQHRTRDGGTLPVWEISAAMSGGMSGGPTVNLDGEVVGVNSYGIVGEEQQFNFVSPAQLVREIASRNGVDLEIDETSQAYRDGVIALNAGDHQEAIDAFDTVLATLPSHSRASELKRIAEQRLAESGPVEPEPADNPGEDSSTAGSTTDDPPVERAAAPVVDDQGLPIWAWGLIAAVVVLLLLIGALGMMLVRQRKPAPMPPPGGHAWPTDNGEPTVDRGQERDPTGPRP